MTTSLSGMATTLDPVTRIICAYSSALRSIPSSVEDNVWYAVGSFTVPELCAARLSLTGSVVGSAVMTVQIFSGARIDGATVSTASSTEKLCVSEKTFELTPDKVYLIAAKCKSSVAGPEVQGLLSTVHLTD